jgi:hypothetical protein
VWLQGADDLAKKEPAYSANVSRTAELMGRDWEVYLWAQEDVRRLLAARRPKLLVRFESLREPAMQADIARFAILEAHGGIYIDVDFFVARSLAPLIRLADEPYLAVRRLRVGSFVHSALNGTLAAHPESLQNYILIGPPGHPVWDIVLTHIENFRLKRPLEHRALYYSRFTCLNALGRSVDKYKNNGDSCTPILYITQLTETFGLHVGKGSWAGIFTTYGRFRHSLYESLNWLCALSLVANAILVLILAVVIAFAHG